MRRFLAWAESRPVDLGCSLSWSNSFRFPLQNEQARREVLWGACLLLVLPGIGWLLNMGHRVEMVHRMHRGESAWPAWTDYPRLFQNGLVTFAGMLYYFTPGLLALYLRQRSLALVLMLAAIVAIPGFMTHYCRQFDPREIFDPFRALSRVAQGGVAYWHAWAIALAALALSFLGLLFGLAFLATSVWFWQTAAISFATVFTRQLPRS
ncbi:MAG: hypothetical protein AMXMBFR33_48270 [Candidatus Xenobia bacterium]